MRLELLFLCVLLGLAVGIPKPQDEEDAEDEEEAEADEFDEYQEYDVADVAEDAKGFLYKPGILEEDPDKPEDEASVGYFNQVDDKDLVGAERSDSFSAVKEGWVTPVRDQGKYCASCAAFATLAVFEICYKKLTGKTVDFSEQQLLECGNKLNSTLARGCNKAYPHAYMYFMNKTKNVSGEKNYPYLGKKTKLPKCAKPGSKAALPINDEVQVDAAYWTKNSTEELLRKLVFLHGAVLSTIDMSHHLLDKYKSGIFEGCPPTNRTDHAIAVVGYGREKGKDFWLIKNSWGSEWGEKGYLRLKRGVGMCGIGKHIATISCEKISKCEDDESCEETVEASDEEEDEDEEDEDEEEEDVDEEEEK